MSLDRAWKGHSRRNGFNEPVIQLDVLPTALAADGVSAQPEWRLDGINILPLLEGKARQNRARDLFFRYGAQLAVRSGEWKLVKAGRT